MIILSPKINLQYRIKHYRFPAETDRATGQALDMCTDGQIVPFDVVGAAVSSPMDFRGDEEFILPEFIRIDQSGIGQFIGNLTQRFIGTRSNRETDDGFVSAVQSIGHPDMIFFTADKDFDFIDFILCIGCYMWSCYIFGDGDNSFNVSRRRYFQ